MNKQNDHITAEEFNVSSSTGGETKCVYSDDETFLRSAG